LNQNSETIKKIAKEQAALKIDASTEYSTFPCKAVVTGASPAPLACIVNPMIDSCVKNITKKVADYSIDKCFDNRGSINSGVDHTGQSTRSFFQHIYGFFTSPCKVEENKESKENIKPENK
jgi:hypothetical protein